MPDTSRIYVTLEPGTRCSHLWAWPADAGPMVDGRPPAGARRILTLRGADDPVPADGAGTVVTINDDLNIVIASRED